MHEANARDKAQGFENIFGANGSERLGNKVFLYYFNKSNIVGSDLKVDNKCSLISKMAL